MFAPLSTATSGLSRAPPCSTCALSPAIASAPAGSTMPRVSSNTSLIAAQIWSFVTRMTPSAAACTSGNVCRPTWRTATPSAKSPGWLNGTGRPAASACHIASESVGSTPNTRTNGMSALT